MDFPKKEMDLERCLDPSREIVFFLVFFLKAQIRAARIQNTSLGACYPGMLPTARVYSLTKLSFFLICLLHSIFFVHLKNIIVREGLTWGQSALAPSTDNDTSAEKQREMFVVITSLLKMH